MDGSWPTKDFPKLIPPNHQITSVKRNRYNCIAWAAGSNSEWWWPVRGYYWPKGVPRIETVGSFEEAFRTLGYRECRDGYLEDGVEKIALFAKCEDRMLKPTHAARQMPDGSWTSKLGTLEDIRHENLDDVSGPRYGVPVKFMSRKSPPPRPVHPHVM